METTCPYLGFIDDPHTHSTYPETRNACHRANPPQRLSLAQQRACCLTPAYRNCPGCREGWPGALPAGLRDTQRRPLNIPWRQVEMGAVVLLALGALGGLGLDAFSRGPRPVATIAGGLNPPTVTATGTFTPIPSPLPSLTPQPTDGITATPPAATPGPALETPFGSAEVQFVVHQVAAGEALESIAARYATSVEALQAVNTIPTRTLWVGSYLIVCPGRVEAQGLPTLAARFLTERTPLDALAGQTGTAPEDLRAWNALGEGEWIEPGRWVVVRSGE